MEKRVEENEENKSNDPGCKKRNILFKLCLRQNDQLFVSKSKREFEVIAKGFVSPINTEKNICWACIQLFYGK